MRFLKLLLSAALVIGLVPAVALTVANSQKHDLNARFVAAITGNDPVKVEQLRQHGITFESFCRSDEAGEFDETCSYIHTQQNFELAAYATLALGALALAMSLLVPLMVGGNRAILAVVFNPTVRI